MKLFTLLFSVSFLFFSCTEKKTEYKVIDGFAQGGTFHIMFQTSKDSVYDSDIYDLFAKIDASLSLYSDSSIISRINNNDISVTTDSLFEEIFKSSIQAHQLTSGLFDITVGPLVRAWGFMPEGHLQLDSAKVDSLIRFVGMDKIRLENHRIIKSDPRIKLDLNAIAQGFTVDKIALYLESKHIKNFIIELGGEVRTKGINDEGKFWKVGIDKPESNEEYRELQTIVSVSDKSLATSGSYRKFIEENGIKYSHTVNPKTGYPTHHNLLSVTVIADNCTMADALATGIMVMGLKQGKDFVESHKNIEAYFIYANDNGSFSTWYSPALKNMIEPVR